MSDAAPSSPMQTPTPRRTAVTRLAVAAALLVIAAVPLLPLLAAGHVPFTHDALRYPSLSVLFADALAHGIAYPRWLPDLAGGMGYPTFVFYQPLFFYVSAALLGVGLGPLGATYAANYLFLLAGAGGAFACARTIGVCRLASLAASALFLLTPFAFVDLHVRGDFSELAAMMLSPWPIAGFLLAGGRSRDAAAAAWSPLAGAAVAIAAIVYAHPVHAMLFLPTCGVVAASQALVLPRGRRLRWLSLVAATFAAGVALAAPYWQGVLASHASVRLDRAVKPPFLPEQHVVDAWQLVSNGWGFGVSEMRSTGRPDGMSFQLGLPHLLLAAAGVIFGRRRPYVIAAAIVSLAMAVAMTGVSAPLWAIERWPLRFAQFPWRLLSAIAPLSLLLAVVALADAPRLSPRARAAIAWGCVALAAAWYAPMFATSPQPFVSGGRELRPSWGEADAIVRRGVAALPERTQTFTGMNEFDPVWVRAAPPRRAAGGMIADEPGVRVEYAPGGSPFHIDAAVTRDAAGPATLQQFYLPGWRVEVDGAVVPDATIRAAVRPDGRMTVALPAGASRVVAYYAAPPGAAATDAVAVVVAIASLGALVGLGRGRAPPTSPDVSEAAVAMA